MTKTIAVLGASGFTGGAIARHFVEQGWRVIGFGRRDVHIEGVDYRQWDITSGKVAISEPIDVLVHSAAKVDDFGGYAAFYKANVHGTQHALDSFRDAGQFIYISSSSVYDPFAADKTNIREDFPYGTRYLNAYGETKMQVEKFLLASRRENLVILRPRAIYGVGDTTLLPRLIRAKRGRYLLGIGDGTNQISLTYMGNLLHVLDCTVIQTFQQEIFNIADAQTVTLRDLLQTFAAFMGWDVQLVFLPKNLAWTLASLSETVYRGLKLSGNPTLTRYGVHQLSSPYTLNIAKAQAILNYAPPYTYREGFAAVKAWLDAK